MSTEINALEKQYAALREKLVSALKKEYVQSKEKLENVLNGKSEYLTEVDPSLLEGIPELTPDSSFKEKVFLFEKHLIIQALKDNEQSIGKSAHSLGLSYQNLTRKIRKSGIDIHQI